MQLLGRVVYDSAGVVGLDLVLELGSYDLPSEEVNCFPILIAFADVVAVELSVLLELSKHRVVPGNRGLRPYRRYLLAVLSVLVGEEVLLHLLTCILPPFAARLESLAERIPGHGANDADVLDLAWPVVVQNLLNESVLPAVGAQLCRRVQGRFGILVQAVRGLVGESRGKKR